MTYHFDDKSLPMIVVIGGGFAGLQLIKRLDNKPYRVILLDKHNYHTFQPLLYQVASAGLSADSIAFPFRKKVGPYPNIVFRMAEVTSVEPDKQIVQTSVGSFNYDSLVVATGSIPNFFGNQTLQKYGMPLKYIPDALNLRSDILQEFEKAIVSETMEAQQKTLNFVIVGGGPTGVELAGALAEIKSKVLPKDYRELQEDKMVVQLIEGGDKLLGGMSDKAAMLAKKYLEKLGVKILLNTRVENYDGNCLLLANGEKLSTDNIIWTAGVKGAALEGMDKNSIGRGSRYLTDPFNNIKGYGNIYAIGDVALIEGDEEYPNGHPGVAQVALQQARNLADNFVRLRKNKSLIPFKYKDKGSMATIGRHRAVVDLPFLSFGGYLAWYIWMFVHLMALVGFRNRFMVLINWMWNYFTYDKALRLIIRPYHKPE